MQKLIHYEDNLFFIISQIEQLHRMLELSLDGNFLCDKYILDVNYFNKILSKIEETILENPKIMNFLECVQLMRRARGALETLLRTIQRSDKELAVQFSQKFDDELNEVIAYQTSRYDILLDQLAKHNKIEDGSTETIGMEEMQLLISPDFDEEDQDS